MKHQFRTDTVASEAGVPEETVLTMLQYRPVKSEDATKVLAALSRLHQEDYTFKTVRVRLPQPLEKPSENASDVAATLAAIDAEYESGRSALHGLSQGTSLHNFITKRLENIAQNMEELSRQCSPEAVMEIITQLGENKSTSKEVRQ